MLRVGKTRPRIEPGADLLLMQHARLAPHHGRCFKSRDATKARRGSVWSFRWPWGQGSGSILRQWDSRDSLVLGKLRKPRLRESTARLLYRPWRLTGFFRRSKQDSWDSKASLRRIAATRVRGIQRWRCKWWDTKENSYERRHNGLRCTHDFHWNILCQYWRLQGYTR